MSSDSPVILVVEDEALVGQHIAFCLRQAGYGVLGPEFSGEMAIQVAAQNQPNLVLMDIGLQGEVDGIHAATEIRQYLDIPVIYLTAFVDYRTLQRAKLTEPFGYVLKPFEERALLATIEMALHKHQLEKQLRRRNQELTALNAISRLINQGQALEDILPDVLAHALQIMGMQSGWMQLFDPTGTHLQLIAQVNLPDNMLDEMQRLPGQAGPSWEVIHAGQPFVFDANHNVQWQEHALVQKYAVRAAISVPIQSREHRLGVLGVFSSHTCQVDAQSIELMKMIGLEVGTTVENRRLMADAQEVAILQELNRLRSELIANVSHELRTPLGLIKVFASTLLRQDVHIDPLTQREFLQDIDQEADKLEEIVDNLLDLSRLESQRLKLNRRPVDLGGLCRQVTENFQYQVPENLTLLCDLPDLPLMASVDETRIEQVLRNLLNNAVKYSPHGGTVQVQGRKDPWQILIWVRDEGIGVSSEDAERIFERFYRVDNEWTRRLRGAGLGLAVCRGIIEAHGGKIWVESSLGSGSTFYFSLPVLDSSLLVH